MKTALRPYALVAVLWLAAGPAPLEAQSEETAILEVVQRLFDAMEARDTALARPILLPEGRFWAVGPTGEPNRMSHEAFLDVLASPGPDLLERMWDAQVLVHGPIAVVWTPYDFYADGAFSHCGVDAFSMIRTRDGWKIAGIVYTVEPEGCPESPLGPPES